MKKLLVIVGTPRSCGNSEMLALNIAKGFVGAGGVAETVKLREFHVKGCLGCMACKSGSCIQKDDMTALYGKITDANVILLSTPIYWWGPSGLFKTFLDRWLPFIFGKNKENFKDKAFIIATTHTDESPDTPMWAHGMLRESITYLGGNIVGIVDACADKPGDMAKQDAVMKQAMEVGRLAAK